MSRMHMRSLVVRLLAAVSTLTIVVAQSTEERLSLWPNGAPGSERRRKEPEEAKDYWVKNVHDPSVTVFLPPPEKASGAAVIVVPGGGHRLLVFNAEGRDPAQFLASLGVAAFALKYRLAREEGCRIRLSVTRVTTRTVRCGWYEAAPRSGTSIPRALASWDFRRAASSPDSWRSPVARATRLHPIRSIA
jgi:hypothetical protein